MKEWLASLPPIPVSTVLLYIFAIVLSLAFLAYLGYLAWKSWKRLAELELKDRFAARNDFIKTTAQILGGAFFLFGLYFTWANVVATQEKNITDLYTKAVEQLGSDKLEVRLGGIYALERIARQSPKDHWPIMEVLTAYVRENAPWPPEEFAITRKKRPWAKPRDQVTLLQENGKTEGKGDTGVKPDPDIQAVLTVLGRTAIPFAQTGEKRRLDLNAANLSRAIMATANLRGANLTGANMQGADFWRANLQGTVLWNANLQEAKFEETNLQKTYLVNANLQGALFVEANLQGASLWKANLQEARILAKTNLQGAHLDAANLQGAQLNGANLQGAFLSEANLQKANFQEANLQGVYLSRANLQGTSLWKAKLLGADLSEAIGLTSEQVAKAFWDETTKWPKAFTPPAPRRLEKKDEE